MNVKDRDVSTEARTAPDAEGPLRRWVRRKREVAREEQAAAEARREDMPDETPDVRESNDDAPEPAVVEEKVLTDEDMPSIESLDEDGDYSGFLSPGVSEELRRRALRRLFSSAVFNVPDGLDDYDDDFTSFAALGDIVTSDMKHQAEMEAERAEQARADTEPATRFEDESSRVENERLAPAGDEATGLAEEDPADRAEPSAPPALTDPEPLDSITNEDAAERPEPPAPSAHAGRGTPDSLADGRPLVGTEAPGDDGAASLASGDAGESGESSHSQMLAEHDPPNSVAGDRASIGTEAPANTGEADHR